jgi:uncharacterized Zn-finger protein
VEKREATKHGKIKSRIISMLSNVWEKLRLVLIGSSGKLIASVKLDYPVNITLDYSEFWSGAAKGEYYYIKVNGKSIYCVGSGFVNALNKAMEIKRELVEQCFEVKPLVYVEMMAKGEHRVVCLYCGTPIVSGAQFCYKCGKKITES